MRIKIMKASKPTYWYADKIGQVFEAEYGVFHGNFRYKTVDPTDGEVAYVETDDAEVVTSADIIVHDGKQYRKVDRLVREGDAFIVPKMAYFVTDLTPGKVYALKNDGGRFYFIDDVGDKRTSPIVRNDVYVLEPVAPTLSALETELAATKAKVAEMEAQLAEVKRVEAEAQRLRVGDYGKIVADGSGRGEFKPHGFKLGEIVQVESVLNDRVSAIGVTSREFWYIHNDDLTRATDEEVAEAKRKAEETAKWAAIGRKPGEFKVGDIAKITRYQCGLPEGTIFAVTGIKREKTVETPGGYGADVDCIELVAPVESVVNLRVS